MNRDESQATGDGSARVENTGQDPAAPAAPAPPSPALPGEELTVARTPSSADSPEFASVEATVGLDADRDAPEPSQVEPRALGELLSELTAELGDAPQTRGDDRRVTRRGAIEPHILFRLASARFAIPLDRVLEVGRVPRSTPVPRTPLFVRGVANLRGDVLALIDLRALLHLDSAPLGVAGRLLVVRASDGMVTGLIVDHVLGARPIERSAILPPAAPLSGELANYLRGVVDEEEGLLLALDLERLLQSSEMRSFEDPAASAAETN